MACRKLSKSMLTKDMMGLGSDDDVLLAAIVSGVLCGGGKAAAPNGRGENSWEFISGPVVVIFIGEHSTAWAAWNKTRNPSGEDLVDDDRARLGESAAFASLNSFCEGGVSRNAENMSVCSGEDEEVA